MLPNDGHTGIRAVEVMLQWVDDLDDLVAAAGHLLENLGYCLAAPAGVAAAALGGVALGSVLSLLMGIHA